MNREEAGRGGGGRVGSGILENQQLAVCLLGEEELQEKGWGGGVLQGCSGLQSMDARRKDALASRAWMPAVRMLWPRPPEHGCLLQGCSGRGLQSQPTSWMEKERLKVPREWECGLREGGLLGRDC